MATGSVLSRPVSPKLAHEAVLAKPPYFDAPLHRPVQNEGKWCPKYRSDPQMTQMNTDVKTGKCYDQAAVQNVVGRVSRMSKMRTDN